MEGDIMEYKNQNFSIDKLPKFKNDDEFVGCNFTQKFPFTSIGSGKKNLKFTHCNLLNCKIPADATAENCLQINKSFCYHLHPGMGLPPEVDNCEHVVKTNNVQVDGQVVAHEYIREDSIVVEG